MMSPGSYLSLLIGPTIPVPVPAPIMEALEQVEVAHADGERSGFQLVFRVGRAAGALAEVPLLNGVLTRPGNRVIVIISSGARPEVLMDGLITHQELAPGEEPGRSRLTLTGEDVSLAMDREEKTVEHPAQNEYVIATKIIASYARFGLIPLVIPPLAIDVPLPTERTPVQRGTDLQYLQEMAARYDYVFHVSPGPAPGTNKAYWGPTLRLGIPQRALSVDLGAETNVTSITFQNDAAAVTQVSGVVQDRQTNTVLPVRSFTSLRPPLAASPALLNRALVGLRAYQPTGARSMSQALTEAQAATDASMDVVTAEGELDTARYRGLLQARGLVGLRGVGQSYNGLYYVKRVSHTIRRGSHTQAFTLVREGTGATLSALPV